MAKKPSTAVVVAEEENTLPAYLAEYTGPKGTEALGREDIKLPVLKILQGMSPEVTNDPRNYHPGQFYHSGTGDMLEEASLRVVVLSVRKTVTLWQNRDAGGGMLAHSKDALNWTHGGNEEFELKWPKQGNRTLKVHTRANVRASGLTKWGTSDPKNPNSPPAATETYEYLLYLLEHPESSPIVARLYRTATNEAKDLNTILKCTAGPIQSQRLKLNIIKDTNDSGDTWFGWNFKRDGYLDLQECH